MKAILLLLISCTCATLVNAQLSADFSTSDGKTGGCSPFTVSFKNTTKGASANAVYKWDLGNNNTSNLQNPGASYPLEKTYTVTLTVTDSGNTSVKSMDITVYKKPVVDFSVNNVKGCLPFTTTFTSSSIAGDGTISNYFWDFGDGTIKSDSVSSVISHTFNSLQQPRVDLIVTNSYGCQNTLRKSSLIQIQSATIAAFKADKNVFCKLGDTISFTNNSTGGGALSYTWDFGDGTTSTTTNPVHTYSTKGAYTVKLTAANNFGQGCTTTLTQPGFINISSFNSDITLPAALCNNTSLTFQSKSDAAATSATWFFSDENFATAHYGLSVVKTFTTAQTYQVKMVNIFGACRDTVNKTITINKVPMSGFAVGNYTVCNLPVTVGFTDTSAAAVAWNWDFGNNTTSNAKNPAAIFTQEDSYTVALTISDAAGCKTTVNKTVVVAKPDITITYLSTTAAAKTSGCAGFTLKFAAVQAAIIASYSWDFGDGSTATSAQPQHTFTNTGNHTVKLTCVTLSGCTVSVKFSQPITVYEKPKADFATADTSVCGSSLVTFTDMTGKPATMWSWDFGDSTSAPFTNAKVTHRYKDSGNYNVTLIAHNQTCSDTIEKKKVVKVLPLFSNLDKITGTCDGLRDTVAFTQASKYVDITTWDFGDNTSKTFTTGNTKINHGYKNTGRYNVVLTVSNSYCTYKDSSTVYVLLKQAPQLKLAKDRICASDSLAFTATGFEESPYPNTVYTIKDVVYNDGSAFTGTINAVTAKKDTSYSGVLYGFSTGISSLRIITTSANFGCLDTSNFAAVQTRGPLAGFSVSNNNSCFKIPVTFNDTSKSTNAVAITNREWAFGDGTTQVQTNGGSFTHHYGVPNAYNAYLKITDAEGCWQVAGNGLNAISVGGPKADFQWSPAVVYAGSTTTFANNSNTFGSSNTAYTWSFSSNATTVSGTANPQVFYNNKIPADTVKLIARNPATNCADTIVKVVTVELVKAAFTYTSQYINNANCPPMVATFTGNFKNVSTSKWDFGDGTIADNITTPVHTYPKPGIFKITLYGTGKNGITDTISEVITIKGPYASISADVQQGCVPAKITLKASLKNAVVYTWDYGDGTLSANGDTITTHTYQVAGTFTPSLIMKDSAGCKAIFELPNRFLADTLSAGIKASSHLICDNGNIRFSGDIASVADTILSNALSYKWSFGTGNASDTSVNKSPSFSYTKPGIYPVKLKAVSITGCTSESIDSIEVSPKIKGTITGPADACENANVLYKGSINTAGNSAYNWLFNGTVTDNKQQTSSQHFGATASPVNIRLITTLRGCSDTATAQLTIHTLPAINLIAKSARICRGDSVQLTAKSGNVYQWSPALPAINAPFARPLTSTKYTVKATDSYGCVNYDSTAIEVVQPFSIMVSKDAVICAGTSTTLQATGATTYKWITGVQDLSNAAIANPAATPKATSTYKIVGYDAYGCFTDTAAVKITVAPLPTINAGADIMLGTGSVTTLKPTVSNDVVKWSWSPNTYLNNSSAAAPVATPRTNITYVATVTTQYGCQAKDTVAITLSCVQDNLKMPNAFTPNRDGLNEVFYPLGKGIRNIRHFVIYNRGGQMIYQRDNFTIGDKAAGWDGTHNGYEQPTGVYVYMIEAECDTGDIFPLQGTVTLIR